MNISKKLDDDVEGNIEIEQEKQKYVPCVVKPKFFKDVSIKHKKIQKSLQKTRKMIEAQRQEELFNQTKKSMKTLGQSRQRKASRKVLYFNGNKIEGIWKDNKLQGYTTIQYQSGQYFQGYYQNGQKVSGIIRFKDGTQYSGGFCQNLFHGYGTLKDPTNRVISCNWEYGKPEAKVKIQYTSGDIYYGEIKNLQKHGQGHLFFKSGSKYIGEFLDGKIHGFGTFYENDAKKAQGRWVNGVLQEEEQVDEKAKLGVKPTNSYTQRVSLTPNQESQTQNFSISQYSQSPVRFD